MVTATLDVLALGEALIDFVADRPAPRLQDVAAFRRAAGGAPANLAVGVARLGRRSGLLGRVGADAFGHFLQETLTKNGVDVTQLALDPEHRTGLAFVSLGPGGERSFEFFRHPAADMFLAPADVNPAVVGGARILHLGSNSLAVDPCRSAALAAIGAARSAGGIVSFDVNLRLALWPHPELARERILAVLPEVDVLKVSEEEAEFLRPRSSPGSFAAWGLEQGARLVAVTLGAAGCYLASPTATRAVPGFAVNAVDTTGAGDGFLAGLLHQLLAGDLQSEEDLVRAGRFAGAVGALVVTKKGAIPAMPTLAQVTRFLARRAGE